jgi:mRNA-degrading endonuclease RelE of RelBE toxin-antitoxin system
MTSIIWDPKARDFLRKLPKENAKRIVNKIDEISKTNTQRFLKNLKNIKAGKIRIGDYRLFTDYYKDKDELIIRSIRHRRNAYKK